MNMKEWVRRTWQYLDQRPAAEIDQGYTTSQIRTVLIAAIEMLADELEQDGDLTLRGFGKLYVEIRMPRRINSHLMGTHLYHVPARRRVRFQISERLIARLNRNFQSATDYDIDWALDEK